MLSLFKKKKKHNLPTISSVKVPTFDFTLNSQDDDKIIWMNDEGSVVLSVNFFQLPPDLPSLRNIDTVWEFYKNALNDLIFIKMKN